MNINVYSNDYKYGCGLVFVEADSVQEDWYINDKNYSLLCKMEDLQSTLEKRIKEEGEADFSCSE